MSCQRSRPARFDGQRLLDPESTGATERRNWTEKAFRIARRADECPQIHQCLDEVARPFVRHHVEEGIFDLATGRLLDPEQSGDDALDIGVDRRRLLAECDRRNRRRGVASDTGELSKRPDGVGKTTALCDLSCTGDQVACAGVVAEPCPLREDVLVACGGKRTDSRPSRNEPFEPWPHRSDRGLLEHHFAQPHAVRIGRCFARRRAPR